MGFSATAQSFEEPLREFRGVWIATVGNIDWPSGKGLSVEQQKAEILNMFDIIRQNNMNAVVVQIRPSADAFYASSYEPWSVYLTGRQGTPPSPYYDPLEFMIEEAHKRCIEFHAWFNPYRALVTSTKNPNPSNHITWQHPEWFVDYGGKRYFDPGIPEVKAYFIKVVMDVVKRYDVDAIHFDDYFYPYRVGKTEFPDWRTYQKYGKDLSKDDWRRTNVNQLVRDMSRAIKNEKPWVKFGISPFGVWRNQSVDPEGSLTHAGQTNYDDLFADILLWQKEGWIDYCLPQLYWERGNRSADFSVLIDWWNQHAYKRSVYIGLGVYKLGSKKGVWQSTTEITDQVETTRQYPRVSGSCMYSMNALVKNKYNINHALQTKVFKHPALVPSMPWLEGFHPVRAEVQIRETRQGDKILEWHTRKGDWMYAIYKLPNPHDIFKKELVAITRETHYIVPSKDENYFYAIGTLDRLYNESELSDIVR